MNNRAVIRFLIVSTSAAAALWAALAVAGWVLSLLGMSNPHNIPAVWIIAACAVIWDNHAVSRARSNTPAINPEADVAGSAVVQLVITDAECLAAVQAASSFVPLPQHTDRNAARLSFKKKAIEAAIRAREAQP